MATLVQSEWIAAVAYIGFPLYYLFTSHPFSRRDQRYYEHLTLHSRVYPRPGPWQNIFWIGWTILYIFIGVASYLFWRDADSTASQYVAGLTLHWLALLFNFGWSNVFFKRRRPIVAFIYCIIIVAGSLGFFICAIILGMTASAVLYAFNVAWLVYATVMTAVAAFSVPPYKEKTDSDEEAPLLPQPAVTEQVSQQQQQQPYFAATTLQQQISNMTPEMQHALLRQAFPVQQHATTAMMFGQQYQEPAGPIDFAALKMPGQQLSSSASRQHNSLKKR